MRASLSIFCSSFLSFAELNPVSQPRSPFAGIPVYSPSPLSGSASLPSHFSSVGSTSSTLTTLGAPSTPSSSIQLAPTLTEDEVTRLTAAAERWAIQHRKTNPEINLEKFKKRSTKETNEIMRIIRMSETDPRRMEGIRKFSAIYGRFDRKRDPDKPLTLFQVRINEATAQMCKFIPAMLTNRNDLFTLARSVVRDAGFIG